MSLRTSRPVFNTRPRNSIIPFWSSTSEIPRDAQLPPALALWLREAEDDEIWNRALKIGAVLITKDEDFPNRASQTASSPVIVWLRIGNATNQALRQWFMPQLPQIMVWINQGVRVLEIR